MKKPPSIDPKQASILRFFGRGKTNVSNLPAPPADAWELENHAIPNTISTGDAKLHVLSPAQAPKEKPTGENCELAAGNAESRRAISQDELVDGTDVPTEADNHQAHADLADLPSHQFEAPTQQIQLPSSTAPQSRALPIHIHIEAPAGTAPATSSLNEAEMERQQRIRRNMEVMRSLGLGINGSAMLPQAVSRHQEEKERQRKNTINGGTNKQRASAARRKRSLEGQPLQEASQPLRRSLRSRRGRASDEDGGNTSASASLEQQGAGGMPLGSAKNDALEPDTLEYKASAVHRYLCEIGSAPWVHDGIYSSCKDRPEHGSICGFIKLPGTLIDTGGLSKSYSVDWRRPGLVAAGGKDGMVAVWGTAAVERGMHRRHAGEQTTLEVDAHLSHRLHKGWVSDVQFLSLPTSDTPSDQATDPGADVNLDANALGLDVKLLTAGNDGMLCLWDITKSAFLGGGKELPRCLARDDTSHASGIFSMQEMGGRVATASKDSSVAVNVLRDGGFELLRRYKDLHAGVVKCVRWRPDASSTTSPPASSLRTAVHVPHVFASCGNDKAICITDTRQSSGASLTIECHSTAINCVRWSPANENILLSASHDPYILVHDVRKTDRPLLTLAGHAPLNQRMSAIVQPAFVAGGDAIVVSGERSTALTLYETSTGEIVSQGDAGMTLGAVYADGSRGDPLLCTGNRCVAFFAPMYKDDHA